MPQKKDNRNEQLLLPEDLIPDSRLKAADTDAFGHEEIANRVLELTAHAEPPVNIALFGSWGSGKSSFYELIRRQIKKQHPEIRSVRYDAWKYGGTSLKRNFISHSANELGLEDEGSSRKYHRGLYESKKSVEFDPLHLVRDGRWKAYVKLLFLALSGAAVVLLALALVTSLFTDSSFWSEVEGYAPGVLGFLGTGLFGVGAVLKFLDGMKVEVDQTIPSEDERFAQLFKQLIGDATKSPVYGRRTEKLLFFIDELDRCSKADVVATLESLRTFLDQDRCVFVVAADRDVLEAALDEVEQTTPVREEEPYYSSASAYLDKIFQHQFALPHLRLGRLTGFARDLVSERGGLWGDLQSHEDGDLFNNVLYALIPAHVRSPRRVKVLLNNYATNVRVAQARGIDWLARAAEIAKLTVLQTEFPRLATDLYLEPRLPSLLLRPADDLTSRQKTLTARHRGASSIQQDEASGEAEEPTPPDGLLGEGLKNQALRTRQREDLIRYLESRHAVGIPDPSRDLLYLEPIGSVIGLADIELSQMLEDRAANEPHEVAEEIRKRQPAERVAAARVLGQLSEKEFGPERRNVMTTLAGALEGLGPDETRPYAGDLLAHVRSYRAQEAFQTDQLPGLLVVACASPSGQTLRREIFQNEQLLEDTQRLKTVSLLLPHLSTDEARTVARSLAELYPSDPNVLLDRLHALPVEVAATLIEDASPTLVAELQPLEQSQDQPGAQPAATAEEEDEPEAGLSSEEVVAAADALFEALDGTEGLADAQAHLTAEFLKEGHADIYEVVLDHSSSLAPLVSKASLRNRVGLTGIRERSPEDWSTWSEWLQPEPGRSDGLRKRAIGQVVAKFPNATQGAKEAAPLVLKRIQPIGGQEIQEPEAVIANLKKSLDGANWWTDDGATAERLLVFNLSSALRETATEMASRIDAALQADLDRLSSVAWDLSAVRRLGTLVTSDLFGSDLAYIADRVEESLPRQQPGAAKAALEVQIARIRSYQEETPTIPTSDTVQVLAEQRSTEADSYIVQWLELGPNMDDVLAVLAARRTHSRDIAGALGSWVNSITPGQQTQTYVAAVTNEEVHKDYFTSLTGDDLDQEKVVYELAQGLTASNRGRIVAAVGELPLNSFQVRKQVAQIAYDLFSSNPNKAKSEDASKLVAMLDGGYGLKGKIADAASRANADGQMKKSTRRRLKDAGVKVKSEKGSRPFWRGREDDDYS